MKLRGHCTKLYDTLKYNTNLINHKLNNLVFATDVPIELKADNGATDHFTENTLHNLKKVPTSSINPAIQVIATNGDIVISIYTTNLPINNLLE